MNLRAIEVSHDPGRNVVEELAYITLVVVNVLNPCEPGGIEKTSRHTSENTLLFGQARLWYHYKRCGFGRCVVVS